MAKLFKSDGGWVLVWRQEESIWQCVCYCDSSIEAARMAVELTEKNAGVSRV